jgi:hypothetical protein
VVVAVKGTAEMRATGCAMVSEQSGSRVKMRGVGT